MASKKKTDKPKKGGETKARMPPRNIEGAALLRPATQKKKAGTGGSTGGKVSPKMQARRRRDAKRRRDRKKREELAHNSEEKPKLPKELSPLAQAVYRLLDE